MLLSSLNLFGAVIQQPAAGKVKRIFLLPAA